jgi:hypothetical protein
VKKQFKWLAGGKNIKPSFVESVPIYMVEVVVVFVYFSCFLVYVGMVGVDVGCDLCSLEVSHTAFSSCRVFSCY